jgi:hypothetical protein
MKWVSMNFFSSNQKILKYKSVTEIIMSQKGHSYSSKFTYLISSTSISGNPYLNLNSVMRV